MSMKYDEDGARLPIKIDSTTNGETIPKPLKKHNIIGNEVAQRWAGENSRKLGVGRRAFMTSMTGAASTLLAFNHVNQAFAKTGGYFDLPTEAGLDGDAAYHALAKREFIFDVQGHHFNPWGQWRDPDSFWLKILNILPSHYPKPGFDKSKAKNAFDVVQHYTGKAYIKEVFMDSDTDMGVLSFVPTLFEQMPLTIEEASATRDIIDAMKGTRRLLLHGRVVPTIAADVDRMDELVERWNVSAFKTYTQFGATVDQHFRLDDPKVMEPVYQKMRKLGVRNLAIHKGLPLPPPLMAEEGWKYSLGYDIGPAAKANPDINFIIYHSAYDDEFVEGPYNPKSVRGVDTFVRSLLDAGIGPNSGNVFAEIGATWRDTIKDPNQAAHVIGKLLKYVGENNIIWGTDCIFFGSPQDQIQAFRTFQISEQFREKYGYPELTPAIKQKIFGLNGARVYGVKVPEIRRILAEDTDFETAKMAYLEDPDPSYLTYGPKSRREFWKLLSEHNDRV